MTSLFLCSVLLVACWQPPSAPPPASFIGAEAIPPRPFDTAHPMADVRWVLNYDVSQFPALWSWLQTEVPESAERSKAIGAAALIGTAELDRKDVRVAGLAAFDAAIAADPDDARLPVWRGFIRYQEARDANDDAAAESALDDLRSATHAYPSFTPFGITLTFGGSAQATPSQLEEARVAFDTVVDGTAPLQLAAGGVDARRSRRTWDSPIAPFNLPAMQAMIGDLAARMGDRALAQRSYYTAIHLNGAAHWPWRTEVQRRLENVDQVVAGFAAQTEYAIGSREVGSIGVPEKVTEPRFKGRIGNGSCTVCHTHVSNFDLGEPVSQVGWVKVKVAPLAGVPNPQPVAFLLPDGKDPTPAGFAFGPTVDVAAGAGFDSNEELFDGTQLIPAEPGHWFVAMQTTVNGQTYQGYSAKEFGMQRFFDVKAGEVIDFSQSPISLELKK